MKQLDAVQQTEDRIIRQDRFARRLWVSLGALLLVACITSLVWNEAVFAGQAAKIERQQVQFHADTKSTNAVIECEVKFLDAADTEIAASQQAVAHHRPSPKFVVPPPC